MDGRSCGLGGVPADTSVGASSGDTTKVPLEKHCTPDGSSGQVENGNGSPEAGISVDFSMSTSLGVKKGLQKSATFPPPTGDIEVQREGSDDVLTDAPTYERSVSLPPTSKLISAMKGGRQKNGMVSENRHVKWAPDVYDPPVTSVCHSINYSYQRRSKPRRKDKNNQKQKHKGRSKKSQHNGGQNSAVLQAPEPKDVSTSGGGSALDDLGKQETEILDCSISSQEAKCGSSFLRETVAKMHFSTAEAS